MSNPSGKTQQNGTSTSDWRKAITQHARSAKVRYIAEVLSSLEDDSNPQQKMMLAMRFEDTCFQSGKSYEQYDKKISKKLNGLKKKLKQGQIQTGSNAGGSEAEWRKREKNIKRELRMNYGEQIRYIIEKGPIAIRALNERNKESGANNLKKHVEVVCIWSVQIGVYPLSHKFPFDGVRKKVMSTKTDIKYFLKMKQQMEEKIENIRHHVVNYGDADKKYVEALTNVEKNIQVNKDILQKISGASIEVVSEQNIVSETARNIESMYKRANAHVPFEKVGSEKKDQYKATLIHIDKIFYSVNCLHSFMTQNDSLDKVGIDGTFTNIDKIMLNSLEYLSNQSVFSDKHRQAEKSVRIKLEDAWSKSLCYSSPSSEHCGDDRSKRRRIMNGTNRREILTKTRALFSMGNKTPTFIAQQIKSTGARLIYSLDSPHVATCVQLIYGKAFELNIYFAPLFVIFRAIQHSTSNSLKNGGMKTTNTEVHQEIISAGFPTWKSSISCLDQVKDGDKTNFAEKIGIGKLDVSSSSLLNHSVAKKLEFASCRATFVLRKMFADAKNSEPHLDSATQGILIKETDALVKFIKLANDTFSS